MRRSLGLMIGAIAFVAAGADAQVQRKATPERATTTPSTRSLCPTTVQIVVPPTEAQRRAARALVQRGQQAAILGDRAAEREQLRQAAILDPADSDLAYQLARAHEGAGASADAATEYCRFLALAPNAPEAAEARERIAILAADVGERPTVAATEPRGQPAVAAPAPRTAAPAPVITRLSPGRALSLGLVVPGAGQFYAGRPIRGILSLGGAGIALGYALSQERGTTSVQETALDPFGNSYTYTTTRETRSRPHLAPGLAAAGAIAVASAIDAFNYSRRTNDERRVALDVVPTASSLALRLAIH